MKSQMRTVTLSICCLIFLISPVLGQQPSDRQAVVVGPWSIAPTYKADKFDSCTMSRSGRVLRQLSCEIRMVCYLLFKFKQMEARAAAHSTQFVWPPDLIPWMLKLWRKRKA